MLRRFTAVACPRQRALLNGISLAALAIGLSVLPASVQAEPNPPALDLDPISSAPAMNDYLEHGLLQDPTARLGASGDILLGGSFVYPYAVFGATVTLTPWFEAGLRYTQVQNEPYSPFASFSGNQAYVDRAFSFKLRLLEETADHPAVAVGIRDFVGTGLFSAEYLVASRRWYDFDVTAGIGWGQLGRTMSFTNPLSRFQRFSTRDTGTTPGQLGHLPFSGPNAGLFGGVEWHTPWRGVSVMAELDGNDYNAQPFGYDPKTRLPINVGVHWRPFNGMDIGTGFERGNTLMGRVAFEFNVDQALGAHKRDTGSGAQPLPFSRHPATPQAPGLVAADGALDPTSEPLSKQSSWKSIGTASLPSAENANLAEQLRPIGALQGFEIIAVTDVGDERRVLVAPLSAGHIRDLDPVEAIGQLARRSLTLSTHHIDRVVVTIRKPNEAQEQQIAMSSDGLEQSVALTGRTSDAVNAAIKRQAVQNPTTMDRNVGGDTAKLIFADLATLGMRGEQFEIHGHEAVLLFSQDRERYLPAALGPVAIIMAARVPSGVTRLTLVPENNGAMLASVSVQRQDVQDLAARRISPDELWLNAQLAPGHALDSAKRTVNEDAFPKYSWSVLPRTQQQVGGPNGFLLFEIYADLSGEVNLARGWSVGGSLQADIYDNFDKLKLQSDSLLPHVRSDIAQYLKNGKYGFGNLETDYIFNIAPEWYGRVTGGLLETMFAGIDGEVLWRPYHQRFALGVDIAGVKQRGFDERFDMRGYKTVTGLATLYYQWPAWNITTKLAAGRYLAGDKGVTFEISREFDSGIKIGAFATKTNVSAAQFGEGSFDKGIYLSVPLDIFTKTPSTSTAGFTLRPLTRDGGQPLSISRPLYSLTDGASPEQLWGQWSRITQ